MIEPSPTSVLDEKDPGDEVIARFRYQFCIAAINALRLVSQQDPDTSIICENFEDLIVETSEGKFIAVQVKTKARDLAKIRFTEESVQKSLTRFIKLDKQFPEKFQSFQFVTNHDFWEEKENFGNFPWVLEQFRAAPTVKNLRKTSPKRCVVSDLCDRADAEPDEVISVLCRTEIQARREDIRSIERAVEHSIVECHICSELQHKTVVLLARDIISAAASASTKGNATLASQLYAIGADFDEVFSELSLKDKRITKDDVEALISAHLGTTEQPVQLGQLLTAEDLPKGLPRMFQKMSQGGVQARRIYHTQDLVRGFEKLQVEWTLRYGADKARDMVSDLMARTLTDCIEAQSEVEQAGQKYGPLQFTRLKELLEARYVREKDSLYGCKSDHLLGAAGALTEACKVWWSDEFELLGEGA